MPEGHLYHRYARLQQPLVSAGPIAVTSPQGKFAAEAGALDGRTLERITAAGKNLLYRFRGDAPSTVHVHLGMQGIFFQADTTAPPKPQVRLRLAVAEPNTAWDLIAPSTCALITAAEAEALLGRLGPDPLAADHDEGRAVASLRRAGSTAIGAALLDQAIVAGVGNVFRAEALLEEGIHPTAAVSTLDDDQLRGLWRTLVVRMWAAEEAGEIAPKRIYKQQACARCGSEVEQGRVGGRTSYACPACQTVAA